MPDPSQKTLVQSFLSWPRVEERLQRYPAIGRAFPMELLEEHAETPPYFCHYMGWRLGAWGGESAFKRLDELLARIEALEGWETERPMLDNPEFAEFWSLVWQLQVGEHLCAIGQDVRCGNPGPDYSARIDGQTVFVESYAYRKSFGIEAFLEELLGRLDPNIKLDHNYFAPYSLPSNEKTSQFLDDTLRPFLDDRNLDAWRAQRLKAWPVRISAPASTLVIYMDGDDHDVYDPWAVDCGTGDPEAYLQVIIREAVAQKANSNNLANSRPNLVAVNYLLSTEAQMAFNLRDLNFCPILGPNLDGVAIASTGINQRLERAAFPLLPTGPRRPAVLEIIAQPV